MFNPDLLRPRLFIICCPFIVVFVLAAPNGFTSQPADLSIPPSIDVEPKPHYTLVNNKDDRLTLTCTAHGTPTPSIKWQRIAPHSGFPGSVIDDLKGNLNLDAKSDSEGYYRCRAENIAGVAISNTTRVQFAVLNVTPVSNDCTLQSVGGNSAIFDCYKELDSFPRPTITWSAKCPDNTSQPQSRKPLVASGTVAFTDDNQSLVLTDFNETTAACSEWKCSVYNWATFTKPSFPPTRRCQGNSSASRHRTLLYRSQPITAVEGSNVTMTCIFDGNGTVVRWGRQSGRPVRGTESDFTRRLTITNIESDDTDVYTCQTDSEAGDDGGGNITLTVDARPSIAEPLQSRNVTVGQTVTFRCRATGRPPPTVTWYINGQEFVGPAGDAKQADSIRQVTDQGVIEISFKKLKHSFCIACNVSNIHGYQMSSAYVALHQPDADAGSTDDSTDPFPVPYDVINSDPTRDHSEQKQISLTISAGTITGISVAAVALVALLAVGVAAAIFWKKCASRSRPDTDQNEESDTELSLSASTANGASVDSGIDEVGQETDLHIDEPGGVGVDDNIRNEQLKQNLLEADNHNGDMNEDSDSCE